MNCFMSWSFQIQKSRIVNMNYGHNRRLGINPADPANAGFPVSGDHHENDTGHYILVLRDPQSPNTRIQRLTGMGDGVTPSVI